MTADRGKLNKLPWAVTGLLILGVLLYAGSYCCLNLFHYSMMMDSDIAADALVAREMWQEGTLIPGSWYSSSETRILSPSALAALFEGLTGSLQLSMGIACSLLLILILILYAILMRRSGFGWTAIAAGLLLVLALPGSLRRAQLLYLFADYYAVHTCAMLITLWIYLGETTTRPRRSVRRWTLFLIGLILALAMSLSGMRAALIVYAPLAATEALLWLRDLIIRRQFPWKSTARVHGAVLSVLYLAAAFLGTRSPWAVSQGVSTNIRHGFQKMWEEVLPDLLECLGLRDGNNVLSGLTIVFCLLAIYVLIRKILLPGLSRHPEKIPASSGKCENRDREYNDDYDEDDHGEAFPAAQRQGIVLLFFWVSLAVTICSVSFLTIESVWRYYFLAWFILSWSAAMILQQRTVPVGRSDISEQNSSPAGRTAMIKEAAAGLLAAVIVVYSGLQWDANIRSANLQNYEDSNITEIVTWMQENGYYWAYSTFETSNRFTVICDGAVQVSAVSSLDTMGIHKWLSDADWYVPVLPYEMKTAYIIPQSRMDEFAVQLELHEEYELVLETESYFLYTAPYNFTGAD